MDITTSAIGIELAHATLRAAALFLGADDLRPRRSVAPNKVVGNGLRELDRFLSILIDEVAVQASRDAATLDRLRSRRNTANKLRMLQAMLGRRHHPDHRRLRALGRSRDCLFYCDGRVRRADVRSGQMMTAGWPSHAAADAGDLMTTPLGGPTCGAARRHRRRLPFLRARRGRAARGRGRAARRSATAPHPGCISTPDRAYRLG